MMKNLPSIIITSVIGVVFFLIIGFALQEAESEPYVQVSNFVGDVPSVKNDDQNDEVSVQNGNGKVAGHNEQLKDVNYVCYDEDTNSHELITKYTSQRTNLMSEADSNSYIINTIPQGTPVELYEDCDCEWICVAFKNNYGYVYGKLLSDLPNEVTQTNRDNHDASAERISSKNEGNQTDIGNRTSSSSLQEKIPDGATALCRDGTYSFSRHRQGTCSWHGGVAKWF